MRSRLITARWLALLFFLLILAGSSVPGKSIPEIFELTPDKLIHCAEYFILACFLYRWLYLEYPARTGRILFLTNFLGALAGAIDENYQRLIPGRSPDVWDWVLDVTGVILASVSIHYFITNKKAPR
jgi:VanZ family protein